MVRLLLLLVLIVSVMSDAVAARLDAAARRLMHQQSSSIVTHAKSQRVGMVVRFADCASAEELETIGAEVRYRRGDLALVWVPVSELDALEQMPTIVRASIGTMHSPCMDMARVDVGADAVHTGLQLPQSYDGSGVIASLCDIGFDPNHINFVDEKTDELRVKMYVDYKNKGEERYYNDSPAGIRDYITDNQEKAHATHVAGIMAGSHGKYKGIAPGVDIVVATSDLSDAGILAGLEDIVAYAREQGQPAVINMSLASFIGPHDGSDDFCQYLDALGEEAILVLSAGNSGEGRNYRAINFTENYVSETVGVYDIPQLAGWNYSGVVDLWSADDSPFSVAITVYDKLDETTLYTSPAIGIEVGQEMLIASSGSEYAKWEDITVLSDDGFDQAFDGAVYVVSDLDANNGRHRVVIQMDLTSLGNMPQGWGRYIVGLKVEGVAGTHVDVYADGQSLQLRSASGPGWSNGGSTMSISNLCCGLNTISVGAYSTRDSYPKIDGSEMSIGNVIGEISAYSSYGTLADGREMPFVCAPGTPIISSMSSPYAANLTAERLSSLQAVEQIDGTDYYWFSEQGTSMSSPIVAGAIALWLEANPSLTVDDVRRIIAATARRDELVNSDPRWGCGKLDIYAGLKMALEDAAIESVDADCVRPLLTPIGANAFEIFVPNEDAFTAMLYNPSGVLMLSDVGANGSATIDASRLPSGIYLLHISGSNTTYATRISLQF